MKPLAKKDPAYYQYHLAGVVVHSGTAFAGHYYSYIKVCTVVICYVPVGKVLIATEGDQSKLGTGNRSVTKFTLQMYCFD